MFKRDEISNCFLGNQRIIYGKEAFQQLGNILEENNFRKVMLCIDSFLLNLDYVKNVLDELKKQNIQFFEYTKITPNPKESEINNASKVLREKNFDVLLAIGGGSIMDASKMIAALSENKGEIIEYTTHYYSRKFFRRNLQNSLIFARFQFFSGH